MCQTFYLSRSITKEYGAAANNLASLIFSLSKKGTEVVTATDKFLACRSGLSERSVSRIKRLLNESGYMKIVRKNDLSFKGVTLIATQKLLSAFSDVNDTANMADNTANMADNDQQNNDRQYGGQYRQYGGQYRQVGDKHRQVGEKDRQVGGHNINNINNIKQLKHLNNIAREIEPAKTATLENKKSKTPKPTNKIDFSEFEKSQTQTQIENTPDVFDLENSKCTYSVKEALNAPRMSNYTSETSNGLSERYTSEIEGVNSKTTSSKTETAVKKSKKPLDYPKNSDEVLKLFSDWKDKHVQIEPRIQGVNLRLEAEAFFDYWSSNDWKRKGKPIKSIGGTVATWLMNSCTRVRGNYRAPDPSKDLEYEEKMKKFERMCSQDFDFSTLNNDPVFVDGEVIDDDQKLLGGH